MRYLFLILTLLLVLVGATACSFIGGNAADKGAGFCQGRHNVIVEASQQACSEAGSDIAEWIDGEGCYCY